MPQSENVPVDPCRQCNGRGWITERDERGVKVTDDCSKCMGTGSRVYVIPQRFRMVSDWLDDLRSEEKEFAARESRTQDVPHFRETGAGDGPRFYPAPKPRRPHYQEIADLLYDVSHERGHAVAIELAITTYHGEVK